MPCSFTAMDRSCQLSFRFASTRAVAPISCCIFLISEFFTWTELDLLLFFVPLLKYKPTKKNLIDGGYFLFRNLAPILQG